MSFNSLTEFLQMGGHGPYVWSCYLFALLVLSLNIGGPLLRTRQFFRTQSRRLRREQQNV